MPLFPYDPAIDSALEHRHLILAYLSVLVVQAIYVSSLLRRFVIARRISRSSASMHFRNRTINQ